MPRILFDTTPSATPGRSPFESAFLRFVVSTGVPKQRAFVASLLEGPRRADGEATRGPGVPPSAARAGLPEPPRPRVQHASPRELDFLDGLDRFRALPGALAHPVRRLGDEGKSQLELARRPVGADLRQHVLEVVDRQSPGSNSGTGPEGDEPAAELGWVTAQPTTHAGEAHAGARADEVPRHPRGGVAGARGGLDRPREATRHRGARSRCSAAARLTPRASAPARTARRTSGA